MVATDSALIIFNKYSTELGRNHTLCKYEIVIIFTSIRSVLYFSILPFVYLADRLWSTAGAAKLLDNGQTPAVACFLNKVLLKHSHSCLFICDVSGRAADL